MQRTAIITDSNSGITPIEAKRAGVYIVPMPFYIDGALRFEGVDLTNEDFFAMQRRGADITTSQPAPAEVMAVWDEALSDYESAVYIPMSSGLSGSCQTASALAADYSGRVRVVDNKRISVTQRQSVSDALALAQKGLSAGEIASLLERDALNASIYIAVDTMKYLKKGGRITPAAAALGALMDIKPILTIQGGSLDAYAKVRGMVKARRTMLDAIAGDLEGRFRGKDTLIHGAHTLTASEAARWAQEIKQRFPNHEIRMDPLSLSVAAHIGEGSAAVVCMERTEEARV